MGIRSSISAFVVVVFVAGCSSEGPPMSNSSSSDTFAMAESPAFQPNAQASESAVADNAAVVLQQPVRVNGQNVDRPVAAVVGEPAALQKRKIIFNATIALRVDDLDEAFDQLFRLVEQSGGYISSSSAHGNAGSARSSEWTMRIPGGRFSGFTKSVAGLGEVVTNAMTSQEVTAEFHDLEARIRNKQQEEKRLQDYLDNSTAKLEDILKVEKEITRVRGEVESMQGRMRVLADLTSLSTVTVRMSEVVDFVPPLLASEPAFGDQIASTWASTVDSMAEFGQSAVLLAIRVLPWFVVFGIPVGVIFSLFRRRLRISSTVVTPQL
ncbi:MAG: hypothetical protein ACI92S_000583 [Planctomycetaceae bacterium]|jgi:hypothetical protein